MQINPTKFVAMFAGAAVLIGAAVFVTWFLFGRNLDADVRRMIQTMAALKTVRVDVKIAARHVSDQDASVRFGAQGDVDLAHLADPAAALSFAADSSLGAKASGEYRALATDDFLYLNQAPKFNDVDLTAFAKQWIVIPKAFSFATLFGVAPSARLTDDDVHSLMDLLRHINLVHVEKTGVVDAIDRDAVIPYDFVLDEEGVLTLAATIYSIQHGQIDAREFALLKQDIGSWQNVHGTLWIGRRTFLLHKIMVKGKDEELDITFSRFNQPVTIEAPSKDTSLNTVLKTLGFNVAALPTAESASRPTSLPSTGTGEGDGHLPSAAGSGVSDDDPDHDGLSNGFELFYGTDPHNPDTDGDGMNDGDEVHAGRNPRGKGSLFSFGLGL